MQLIIVTGSNKGLGYELVKQLALRAKKTPTKILATSRNIELAKAAVKNILETTAKKRSEHITIEYHQLDIANDQSISDFGSYLSSQFGKASINVLVNNAGIISNAQDPTGSIAENTINTNYFGSSKLTMALLDPNLDLLAPKARIIFIASTISKMAETPKELGIPYFVENFTSKAQLDSQEQDFIEKARRGLVANSFPSPSYLASKAGLIALANILAKQYHDDPKQPLIVSCCPGWVRTDLGGPNAPLSVEIGVKTPFYLATEDFDKLYHHNGKLFTNCTVQNF